MELNVCPFLGKESPENEHLTDPNDNEHRSLPYGPVLHLMVEVVGSGSAVGLPQSVMCLIVLDHS